MCVGERDQSKDNSWSPNIVGVNSRDLMLLDTCRRHNRTISDTSVVYKGRGRPSHKHTIGT